MENRYILLTAAKNEQDYIGATIESVLRQSIPPLAWFIVDDGSVDQTAKIIGRFAAKHSFIHLRSTRDDAGKRSFGAKDRAINAAYDSARGLEFEFVAVHDADITLESVYYFQRLLENFDANPKLGIAAGYIYERSGNQWVSRIGNSDHSTAGAIQMFRRACFERIGGYTPLHFGGEDWLAQLKAEMLGWEIMAIPGLHVYHYRPTSSGNGRWRGLFRRGMMDASFGSLIFFELLKCARRLLERPPVIGSSLRFSGYLWWKVSGRAPLLDPQIVSYLRTQQSIKIVGAWRSFTTK
jgi:biofilm PGA synthesis N-glycosyltransferase PgaC